MTWRFLLRPIWMLGHIAVIAIVVGMLTLGFWQLDRLYERKATNAEIRAAASAPALEVKSAADAQQLTPFRSATLTGIPQTERTVYVRYPIVRGASGYYVLTPFALSDGSSILVNRGWIPVDEGRDDSRSNEPFRAPETVTGIAQRSENGRNQRVGQTESANPVPTVAGVDVPAVAALNEGSAFASLWLQQTGVQVPGAPVLLDPPEITEGPHLSYALQWFSFASIGVIGWLVLLWRQARDPAV